MATDNSCGTVVICHSIGGTKRETGSLTTSDARAHVIQTGTTSYRLAATTTAR